MALVITKAGLEKAIDASLQGISFKITHVGVGTTGYVPNKAQTSLKSESARLAISGGKQINSNQIHLTAMFDGDAEIIGREVGFYLEDGTLFAVDSDPNTIIMYKSGSNGSRALEAFDLILDSVPADSITVDVTGDLVVNFDDKFDELLAFIKKEYLSKSEKASLTTNDGYGNANLTFNHRYGIPSHDGSAGRVTCWTDYVSAQMDFQLADDVIAGEVVSLINIIRLKTTGVDFFKDVFAPNILEKKYTQFAPWEPTRTYKTGEVCTIEVNGEVVAMQMYAGPNMTCLNKNPAKLANRQDGWTNNSAPFWWVPYKSARPGTALWPWMSMTIPEGTLNVVGNSVPAKVFWRVALAMPEFVNKSTGIINFPETGGEFFRVLDQGRGVDPGRSLGSWKADQLKSHSHTVPLSRDRGGAHNSRQGSGNHATGQTTTAGGGETRPRSLAFPILMEI